LFGPNHGFFTNFKSIDSIDSAIDGLTNLILYSGTLHFCIHHIILFIWLLLILTESFIKEYNFPKPKNTPTDLQFSLSVHVCLSKSVAGWAGIWHRPLNAFCVRMLIAWDWGNDSSPQQHLSICLLQCDLYANREWPICCSGSSSCCLKLKAFFVCVARRFCFVAFCVFFSMCAMAGVFVRLLRVHANDLSADNGNKQNCWPCSRVYVRVCGCAGVRVCECGWVSVGSVYLARPKICT